MSDIRKYMTIVESKLYEYDEDEEEREHEEDHDDEPDPRTQRIQALINACDSWLDGKGDFKPKNAEFILNSSQAEAYGYPGDYISQGQPLFRAFSVNGEQLKHLLETGNIQTTTDNPMVAYSTDARKATDVPDTWTRNNSDPVLVFKKTANLDAALLYFDSFYEALLNSIDDPYTEATFLEEQEVWMEAIPEYLVFSVDECISHTPEQLRALVQKT